ncbi:MAG: hypothetical protein CL583_12185 [Alteromonadaceae bacterium]|nr:hypothetical protein [Alteromonadaceae bacterium]
MGQAMYEIASFTAAVRGYRRSSRAGLRAVGRVAHVISAAGSILLLATTAAADTAQSEIPEAGRQKAVQCIACHGVGGETTNPGFPDLAGQNAAYLQNQLVSFKSGSRYHPVMTPVAKSLSDEDIRDLAAYFSALEPAAGREEQQ